MSFTGQWLFNRSICRQTIKGTARQGYPLKNLASRRGGLDARGANNTLKRPMRYSRHSLSGFQV